MPWPPTVANGQLTDAAQYDNLLAAVQVWPGGVSANGNSLTNLTALTSSNTGADPLVVTAAALQCATVKADHLAATGAGSLSIDSPQIWGGNVNAAGSTLTNLATLSARTSDNKLTLNATGGMQVNAPQTWGGNVDGGNFNLSNVATLSVGSGGITTTGNLNGIYKPATSSVVGGVKQGSNVTIAGDGTISVAAPYVLPVATPSVLGGVKQGSNVTIAGDGTVSVAAPYVLPVASGSVLGGVYNRQAARAIVQPPAAYNMDGTIGLIQVSLGDGTNSVINLPTNPVIGDTYRIEVTVTGITTTATVTTRSGAIYWGNANVSSVKIYCGCVATFYCYDGSGWIGYTSPSDWINFTPTNARVGSGTGSVAYVSTGYAQFQWMKNFCTIRYNGTVNVTGTVTRIDIDVPGVPTTAGSTGGAGNYGNAMSVGCSISGNTLFLYGLVSGGAFPAGQNFFTIVLPYATSY